MRVGDAVRLKPDSPLRARLAAHADEVGRIIDTFQDDDEELRIAVAFPSQLHGWMAPLSADDFERDDGPPGEPF